MPMRNILVPVIPEVAPTAQLEAALRVARRVEAHVNAVFLRPDPAAQFAALPHAAVACGVTRDMLAEEGVANEAAARAAFESWRAAHNLPAEMAAQGLHSTFARWSCRLAPQAVGLMAEGRLCDLIVLNFPNTEHPATATAFDAAVFDTGRPTLLVPRVLPEDLLRHVMIAWNGSLEATRAVASALDLLHAAGRVSVFTAPRHADDIVEKDVSLGEMDLVAALVWHGIRARRLAPRPDERVVGPALLRLAAEQEATMLVMGGFTRSRVRQMLLGGVTRHVLGSATVPVLMAH